MFKKLQQKKRNKRIELALNKRDRSGINRSIKSVGILYDGNEIKELTFFKELISSIKISEENVSLLGFVTFDKNQPSLSKDVYFKKDFSWSGDFKGNALNEFASTKFDLLISFNTNESVYLDLVVAQSNAFFKVGCLDGDERLFDLILAVDPSKKEKFNSELLKYLKILGKL